MALDYVQTADGRLRVWDTFRDVTPGALYTYWTEPAQLKLWWPREVVLDPVPGGHYRYGFSSVGHTLSGTFTEVVPGQRLAFTWHRESESAPEQHVVVDFERRDADTLLTVTQGPYGAGKAADRLRQQQLDDWTRSLSRLKAAVRH